MARTFKVIFFLLGFFLLIWMVRKFGFHEIQEGFQTLGWKIFWPIVIIFPCYLFYTHSWYLFLDRFEHHSIPFWTLLKIKLAGEAVNTVTPLGFAGGDPIRIWMLSRNFPVDIGGASVVVDRTSQSLATVFLIFLGILAAICQLQLPLTAQKILGVTAFLILFLILLFLFLQTRRLFEKLAWLSSKLHIRTLTPDTLKKIRDLDQHLGGFYRHHRALFSCCLFLHFLGRMMGVVEIFAIARFLNVPMGPWEALFFAAVIPVTNFVGAMVPGTFGVLEGVVSSLFLALHWNPADGIVLQMVRRLRAFFWIVVGMVLVMLFKKQERRV